MRRWTKWTCLGALGLGALGAWMAWPAWRSGRAIRQIVAAMPAERAAGWRWLLAPIEQPRAGDRIEAIYQTLRQADDAAFIEGGANLRRIGAWGWQVTPTPLMLREMQLLAEQAEAPGTPAVALESLGGCPLDVPLDEVRPVIGALLRPSAGDVSRPAVDAAIAWAGPERLGPLIDPLWLADSPRLRRRVDLALIWSTAADERLGASPVSPEVTAPQLLQRARCGASIEELQTLASSLGTLGDALFAYALRWAEPEQAIPELRAMAADVPVARFVLGAMTGEEAGQARGILMDPAQPFPRRRLAAWHATDPPAASIEPLLEHDLAAEDGSIIGVVLLAERHLPPTQAAALAKSWIGSFNDDHKRAGALLAALLGTHADLLRVASEAEDVPRVRTLQRAALFALGERVGPEDDLEFTWRALRGRGGNLDPDIATCLLLRGHAPVLRALTRLEAGPIQASAVQSRGWLIERFVPAWHEMSGRPVGGNAPIVRLHFEALDALRQLTSRRLRFDEASRTFLLRDEARR